MNKRIDWIDTARGISIFLVVLGHTVLPQPWLNYVFSFHMPLFFFLSGYLFNPQKYPTLSGFALKKTRSLLWPYLVFFIINFIYWVFYFNSKDYLVPIREIILSAGNLHAPFIPIWFLTCLFVLEIYFYILHKKLKPWLLFIAVIISVIVGFYLGKHQYNLFWGADIALMATAFYYIGFQVKKSQFMTNFMSSKWLAPTALIFILINFFLAGIYNYQTAIIYRAYNIDWFFMVTAFTGIFGYFFISKYLKETIFAKIGLWEFLGKNSLIILGLHTITYYYVTDFSRYILNIPPKISVWYAFIYTIITLIVLTPIIYVINRTPLFKPKKS